MKVKLWKLPARREQIFPYTASFCTMETTAVFTAFFSSTGNFPSTKKLWIKFFENSFQRILNEATHGFTFVKGAEVVQFLSLKGEITALEDPATGLTSTDVG